MTEHDVHTLTGAYAADALPDDERREFDQHLEQCPACRQEVAELAATAARLGAAVSAPAPEAMRARVLAEVARTRQVSPVVASLQRRPTSSHWFRQPIGIAASFLLLLALGLGAACSFGGGCLGGLIQPGLDVVIFVIVLAQWPYFARIIFREILPNLLAPIIVYTTLIIPTNILFEAALSFLGVGVQPPTATWGAMIAEATNIFDIAWWFMLAPGIALVLTVLAFNLVGDGLQDALNPKGDR